MRKITKQPKIRKTFTLSVHVWDYIICNVPEGQRSKYVEDALLQRIKRERIK